ncbi:MAG: hypothetical protein Q8N63_00760 [Nanoarchaeota archaeon]|nr:hypothetical protein [Nanoarchaeota archaeon]
MGIEKRVKEAYNKNKRFVLASGTYLLSALVDYTSTCYGISINKIEEISPIYQKPMEYLGVGEGLLIPKLFFSLVALGAARYIDLKHKEDKTLLKAEYFLYPAALLTSLVGLSWIFDNYFLSSNSF